MPVFPLYCSPINPILAQRHDLSMSDFPSHDMAAEFVLLAEQRQVEHDLKEQYEVRLEVWGLEASLVKHGCV